MQHFQVQVAMDHNDKGPAWEHLRFDDPAVMGYYHRVWTHFAHQETDMLLMLHRLLATHPSIFSQPALDFLNNPQVAHSLFMPPLCGSARFTTVAVPESDGSYINLYIHSPENDIQDFPPTLITIAIPTRLLTVAEITTLFFAAMTQARAFCIPDQEPTKTWTAHSFRMRDILDKANESAFDTATSVLEKRGLSTDNARDIASSAQHESADWFLQARRRRKLADAVGATSDEFCSNCVVKKTHPEKPSNVSLKHLARIARKLKRFEDKTDEATADIENIKKKLDELPPRPKNPPKRAVRSLQSPPSTTKKPQQSQHKKKKKPQETLKINQSLLLLSDDEKIPLPLQRVYSPQRKRKSL